MGFDVFKDEILIYMFNKINYKIRIEINNHILNSILTILGG